MSLEVKRQLAIQGIRALIQHTMGIPTDIDMLPEGMEDTPERVVRMFEEMTKGYSLDEKSILKTFNAEGAETMVIVRNHQFTSMCEHHMVMFTGTASVGYIPGDKVVGLSKLCRLVDAFASRYQVQERLTTQIADALSRRGDVAQGVGVVIRAKHNCMCGRGVDSPEAETITSSFRGILLDDASARAEFLSLERG